MREQRLQTRDLDRYREYLLQEERAPSTVENYLRDARAFAVWLDGRAADREAAAAWRERLMAQGRAPATVNAKLSAVNSLFRFLGREGCRVKLLKLQRRAFRETSRELTQREYRRLLAAARERLELLLETICATGIRVSEVRYITVEAARTLRLRARYAPSCCRGSCAGSCCNTPKSGGPPRAKSSAPKTGPACAGSRSGAR